METFEEKTAYNLDSHVAFKDVNPEQFDGLIIPGGRVPEYIRMFDEVPKIVSQFFEENKPVGAICHAAQLLTVIPDLMKGREYTAYPSCEPDVKACGATYIKKNVPHASKFGFRSSTAGFTNIHERIYKFAEIIEADITEPLA